MAINPRSLIRALACILAPYCLSTAAPNAAPTEYQDWIAHRGYPRFPTTAGRNGQPTSLRLAITGVEREDEVSAVPSMPIESILRREVTLDGRVTGSTL